MFSHIRASYPFEVTNGRSLPKTIFGFGKTAVHQELVRPTDLFLSLSVSTRLSCGETEGGQVRKTRLLKITRKAASFVSHSEACARAAILSILCVFLSLLHLLGPFVLGRAPGHIATGCRYIKTVTIVLSCILGLVAVIIGIVEKWNIILLR